MSSAATDSADLLALDLAIADADFASFLADEIDADDDAEMAAFVSACETAAKVKRMGRFDSVQKLARSQATVALVPRYHVGRKVIYHGKAHHPFA